MDDMNEKDKMDGKGGMEEQNSKENSEKETRNDRENRTHQSDDDEKDLLVGRVEALEKKVVSLERQLLELLHGKATAAPAIRTEGNTGAVLAGHQGPRGAQPYPPQPQTSNPAASAPAQPKPKTDWEHLIARVWLPRIFIAVLLIGVVWGFTAAVSSGIITEPVRCLLGLLAAGFMYWQGGVQFRQGRLALGQVLLGGSVAVGLLALFAAHMLYGLIPAAFAFILYVLTIGAGLWTALRRKSQALTVIIMFAGYLVPFLVDSAEPDIWSFTAYETLFSIVMIVLAHRRAYKAAYFIAFGLLHLPLLIGSFIGDGQDGGRYAVMTGVLLQHAVLFALNTFRRGDCPATRPAVSLFLSFGLTAAWMYGLFGDGEPSVYRSVIAVCALVYSVTSYWLFKQSKTAAVHLAIATFAWFLWLVHVLEARHISSATLIEGALAVVLGITLKSRLQQITGGLAYLFGVCSVLLQPVEHIFSAETLAWLVLLVSAGGLYMFLRRLPEGIADGLKRRKNSLLWADSALFLIFISQITGILTGPLSYDMQHLLLSAVWVVYAIAVIVAGVVWSKQKVRLAGILFLFITLLKIIFVDLPDVSTAVRAVLFIGLGSIGVAVSRLFYKRKSDINE